MRKKSYYCISEGICVKTYTVQAITKVRQIPENAKVKRQKTSTHHRL